MNDIGSTCTNMTSVSPAPLLPPLQRMGNPTITVSVSPRGSKIPNHLSHKPTKLASTSGQVNESHTNVPAHGLPEITVTKVLNSSS